MTIPNPLTISPAYLASKSKPPRKCQFEPSGSGRLTEAAIAVRPRYASRYHRSGMNLKVLAIYAAAVSLLALGYAAQSVMLTAGPELWYQHSSYLVSEEAVSQ